MVKKGEWIDLSDSNNPKTIIAPKSTQVSKKKEKNPSRMNKIEEVENVTLSISGKKLLIKVDLNHETGGKTKAGKTQIAVTHGNKFYALDEDSGLGCSLSLTVYKD